jgi:NAD(P)H-dependent FMN reductase
MKRPGISRFFYGGVFMHISLISGSHRQASQTEKVARVIAQSLLDHQQATSTEVLSLAGNPFPLWA